MVEATEISVGGIRIGYRRAGSGPPLVLLHGVLGDSREWTPQLRELSDSFTVVAWDAPGCGLSDDPPASYRLPDYADALAGFIAALGLERAHVLGLSFGGGLALELYRRHPGLVRSLVLASAYAGWAGSLPAEIVEERLARALQDAERPPLEVANEFLPGLITEAAAPGVAEELIAMMSEFHPAGLRAMAHSFAEADLTDVLGEIEVPTLLLYADSDVRSPPTIGRDLQARIPGSEFALLSDAGHQSNLERPEAFNAVVRRFLDATPAAGARSALDEDRGAERHDADHVVDGLIAGAQAAV